MDRRTLENWKKVEQALREAGKTDSWYYKRSVSILSGGKDLLDEPLKH